jgi:hypothetical protein
MSLHEFQYSLKSTDQKAQKNQNDYEAATDVTNYFSGTNAFDAICIMCVRVGLNNSMTPS